jgi:hypothetical protein
VRSELSGRTGIVKELTRAIVLVEFDDIHSNVNYDKAPEAWVPHGVLERVPVSHEEWLIAASAWNNVSVEEFRKMCEKDGARMPVGSREAWGRVFTAIRGIL